MAVLPEGEQLDHGNRALFLEERKRIKEQPVGPSTDLSASGPEGMVCRPAIVAVSIWI